MSRFATLLSTLIEKMDRNSGRIRYSQGRKRIGSLEQYKDSKNIFYLMAPSFGNIGDEAIVEASVSFLRDNYPEYKLIVIDYDDTLQSLKEIRRIIKKEDKIFLQGGGNIGTLYYDAERVREFIISKFKDIKIVSMPQSMWFSQNASGNRRLKRSRKIYNSHPDLTIIAREKYSYERMKENYTNCRVLLNPDIVFYYSKMISDTDNALRKGVFTVLRSDGEDVFRSLKYELLNKIGDKFKDYVIIDTCVPRRTPDAIREKEVRSLLNLFTRAELIVTDRLHGMVLAALAGTPCLAFPSLDDKVLGTYEWIEDIDYIQFINKVDDSDYILSSIDSMLNKDFKEYDWKTFCEKHFSNLKDRIEGRINE